MECYTYASNSDLIPKKDTKSEVWHHLGLQQKDSKVGVEIDKPVCGLCLFTDI